jgi:hypothetical protein
MDVTSEVNATTIKFESGLKNHYIEIELNVGCKEALMCKTSINFEFVVELVLLVKKMCEKLKIVGIHKIFQHVDPTDWSTILSSIDGFVLEKETDDYCMISASIDNFPKCFLKGLGHDV